MIHRPDRTAGHRARDAAGHDGATTAPTEKRGTTMSRTIRTTPLYPRVPANPNRRPGVRASLREQGVRL